MSRRWTRMAGLWGLLVVILVPATSGRVFANPTNTGNHVTDGAFGTDEWTGPNVAQSTFAVVGGAGGATLYVEHSGSNLYLMYDYTNSPAGNFDLSTSIFQIFFQVAPDHHDYLVRINNGGILDTYEKVIGTISSLNSDGSFNVNDPVWHTLSGDDLALAQFQGAVGFGSSPNSSTSHLIAEFQLSVDERGSQGGGAAGSGGGSNGIYSPDPSFWSASVKSTGKTDPPISSEIFQLMPDGSTLATPVFAANGAPAMQPQDVVTPEPSTLVGGAIALIAGLIVARRRRP